MADSAATAAERKVILREAGIRSMVMVSVRREATEFLTQNGSLYKRFQRSCGRPPFRRRCARYGADRRQNLFHSTAFARGWSAAHVRAGRVRGSVAAAKRLRARSEGRVCPVRNLG